MIKKNKDNSTPEVNSSSMADIAFLLLIFFLVTTTITSDKGITMELPPDRPESVVELNKNNVYVILINSQDKMLVEDKPFKIDNLRKEAKLFLNNYGRNSELSDDPQSAVIALKADRGTSYDRYITVLNEIKAAYNELRAESIGITHEEYMKLDLEKNNQHKKWFKSAQEKYPYRVSIAEPESSGGE